MAERGERLFSPRTVQAPSELPGALTGHPSADHRLDHRFTSRLVGGEHDLVVLFEDRFGMEGAIEPVLRLHGPPLGQVKLLRVLGSAFAVAYSTSWAGLPLPSAFSRCG